MRFLTKSTFFQLAIFLLVLLLVQACEDDPTRSFERDFSTVPDPFDLSQADTSYTKKGGVEIYIIHKANNPDPCEEVEEGHNPCEVIPRDQISLHYTGRTSEGEIFISSYANGSVQPTRILNLKPVTTQRGSPQVEGFRRGLLGMREGEKRVIIVPDSLGYNDSQPGTNGMDLRDKNLRYDVELVSILE
jgi:FKBP-type peptidyl-prolyl cis-trans isomerase